MSSLSVVTINPDLLTFKDNILRQQASKIPVLDAENLKLCEDLALEMFEVMYTTDGAAIAAPQVGVSLRLVAMDPASIDFGPHVLINPVIISKSDTEVDGDEGCLSLPRYTGKISRSTEIRVQSFNLKGELEEFNVNDWLARIFQHEIDHLDGVLYPDHLKSGEKLVETDVRARRRAQTAIKKIIDAPKDVK